MVAPAEHGLHAQPTDDQDADVLVRDADGPRIDKPDERGQADGDAG